MFASFMIKELYLAYPPTIFKERLGLLDEPQVNFQFTNVDKINAPALNKILSLIREITNYSEILTTYKTNRWTGCKIISSSIQGKRETC